MRHVAMVIPSMEQIGGAESQALLLAEGLALRRWKVTLVTLSGHLAGRDEAKREDTTRRLARAGVEVFTLGMRKSWVDPAGLARYARWAQSARPDILHAHLHHAAWFARCVRLLAPARLVIETLHSTRPATIGCRILYRATQALSDRTTCVSDAVATMALSFNLMAAGKITVVSNGVPVERTVRHSTLRMTLQEERPCFRWIAVGRLAPVKDYPTLLRAFAKLERTDRYTREAELTILGSGPEEPILQAMVEELGLRSRVHFWGFVDDVRSHLADSDAFVLSSRLEGLPIGVLEAQAEGLPVVATNGTGTSNAMIDGETGFLVPVADPERLANAMREMMRMPEGRLRLMGEAGRHLVAERFSIDRVLDHWVNLYENLLIERPQPVRWALKVRTANSSESVKSGFSTQPLDVPSCREGRTASEPDREGPGSRW